MGDGGDLYHLDKSQCKSCHDDGRELLSYWYKAIFLVMTLKNFIFPKGSFGFGQKVLQEFLTQEPKKIMLLGPRTDSLAKSVAAYAGIPEVGLLQVRRTQRFIAHWRCKVSHGICSLLYSSTLELLFLLYSERDIFFPPGLTERETIEIFALPRNHTLRLLHLEAHCSFFSFSWIWPNKRLSQICSIKNPFEAYPKKEIQNCCRASSMCTVLAWRHNFLHFWIWTPVVSLWRWWSHTMISTAPTKLKWPLAGQLFPVTKTLFSPF